MKQFKYFKILGIVIVLIAIGCNKDSLDSNADLSSLQDKVLVQPDKSQAKKGKPQRCTEYLWRYTCQRTDEEDGPEWLTHPTNNSFRACIDEFRGFERIIGTSLMLNQDIDQLACLGSKQNSNANCYGLVELFTRNDKKKYHVVFTPFQDIDDPNGRWPDCSPSVGVTTCIDINWMEITPDGRHDKKCLTTGVIRIPTHTFCLTNVPEES